MNLKIRFSFILMIIILLTLASLALQPVGFTSQAATPTLEAAQPARGANAPIEILPGTSDGIFAFGVVIFLIILAPMVILRQEW